MNKLIPELNPFLGIQDMTNIDLTPKYLIKGYLYEGSVGQTFGEAASGKSLVALDQALHMCFGLDWHGQPTKECQVWYLTGGEGVVELPGRIAAWASQKGFCLCEFEDRFFWTDKAYNLFSEFSLKRLSDYIEDTWDGESLKYIVVDTLVRHFGSEHNEDSASDMTMFIRNLERYFASVHHACVNVITHTGHNNGNRARGSSTQKSNFSWVYQVKQSNGHVSLINQKMKNKCHGEVEPKGFNIKSKMLNHQLDEDGNATFHPYLEMSSMQVGAETKRRENQTDRDYRIYTELVDKGYKDPKLKEKFKEELGDISDGQFRKRLHNVRRRASEDVSLEAA